MKLILSVFWNICLLRRGPELVPTHPLFVAGVVIADILLSLFVRAQYGDETSLLEIATFTLVTMATLATATWLALNLRGVIGRFPATITAMFGCDLLFTLLIALLIPLAGGARSAVSIGMGGLILIWSIAVNGFILHRAMNITVFAGILSAFGMALVAATLASSAAGH
jgi:hypothetical protein